MASYRGRQIDHKQGGLTFREQEDILNVLHPELRGLNLDQIFPHLNQQGLLTYSEKEKLRNEYFTTHDRIDELIKWVPTKGSDALERFIVCLRNSADGTGHDQLATLLEDELNNVRSIRQQREHPVQPFKDPSNQHSKAFSTATILDWFMQILQLVIGIFSIFLLCVALMSAKILMLLLLLCPCCCYPTYFCSCLCMRVMRMLFKKCTSYMCRH